MPVIETRNLVKKFKDLVAVNGVTLGIEEGECFGLLGPNGSGKTTLIRMITGVSPPNEGDIRVLDIDLKAYPRRVKAILGVVPQDENLDDDLTVLQNLTTFARYFAIPIDEARRRSIEVLDFFHLEDKHNSKMKELSGGMKRRLMLARGLINQPEIMILDEPSVGLDPQAKHLVWQKLVELKKQGVTQLLCTQNMEEAAILCDRVAIMSLGKFIALDSPEALISQYVGEDVLEIGVDATNRDKVIENLTKGEMDYTDAGNIVQVFHSSREEVIRVLDNAGGKLSQRAATLEDVFFGLTGRALIE